MSIGIMGGTFNPIHYGHLRSASEVADRFALEKVLFIPAYIPPHKEESEVAPAEHRLHMTELGIRVDRRFVLSSTEIYRKGTSYTIDTLRQLKQEARQGQDFFLSWG